MIRGRFRFNPNRKRPDNAEMRAQVDLIDHLKLKYPTALYCASAGGMRTHPKVAIQMKKMGYVSGHPDVAIYEPRGSYHGLFIEMKREKGGVVSEEQRKFLDALVSRGYVALVAKGAEEAKKMADDYLKLEVKCG